MHDFPEEYVKKSSGGFGAEGNPTKMGPPGGKGGGIWLGHPPYPPQPQGVPDSKYSLTPIASAAMPLTEDRTSRQEWQHSCNFNKRRGRKSLEKTSSHINQQPQPQVVVVDLDLALGMNLGPWHRRWRTICLVPTFSPWCGQHSVWQCTSNGPNSTYPLYTLNSVHVCCIPR